jgi:hypothetical protein
LATISPLIGIVRAPSALARAFSRSTLIRAAARDSGLFHLWLAFGLRGFGCKGVFFRAAVLPAMLTAQYGCRFWQKYASPGTISRRAFRVMRSLRFLKYEQFKMP